MMSGTRFFNHLYPNSDINELLATAEELQQRLLNAERRVIALENQVAKLLEYKSQGGKQ
jgi:hypothetical protein